MNLYAVLDNESKCAYVANFTTNEANYIPIGTGKDTTLYIGRYYDKERDLFYNKPDTTNADILAALQRSQEELQQETIDSYTMELMEQGIL